MGYSDKEKDKKEEERKIRVRMLKFKDKIHLFSKKAKHFNGSSNR